MALKQRQVTLSPQLADGVTTPLTEPGTGVVLKDEALVMRKATLTLTGFALSVTEALDYGGTKLLDLPDKNMLILGCEIDLVVVKAGTTNGLVAATDLNMGVGSAAASNITLSSTMQNIIEVTAITDDALSVDFEAHSNGNSTSVLPLNLTDSATLALYLNIAVAAGITADDTASVSGTVTIYYADMGNLSS